MKRLLQQWPILVAGLLLISGAGAATVVQRSGTSGAATTTVNVAATSGMAGYWPLDRSSVSGTTAFDKSGHGADASLPGDAPIVAGKLGQGASLDGSEDIAVPLSPTYDQITVSLWFKPASLTGDNPRLMADSHTDSDNDGFQLMFDDGGGAGFFDVGNGITHAEANWSMQLQVGTWYHYVGTYDGSTVRAYINGVEVGNANISGTIGDSGHNISVGGNAVYGGDYFNGVVDDVRIYNRALSAGEIAALYDAGRTTTVNASQNGRITGGLVGHWSFDGNDTTWSDATDGVAHDTSGGGNDGTLTGFSQKYSAVPGKIGQALRFDGNSYITTGYTVPAQDSSSSFTWSVWAKLDNGNPTNAVVLGFRTGDTWIKLTPTKFEYADGADSSAAIPVGHWVHLVIVKDNSTITYYQNNGAASTVDDARSTGSGTFYIGEDPTSPDDGAIKGELDDVRVYDRALSPEEVHALYLLGQ